MKLRREQEDALALSRISDFTDRMVRHLWADLRSYCQRQGLGEEDLDPFVSRGIAGAVEYGLMSEGGIQQYLDCMAILGPDFDRDKEHAWAGEILRNPDMPASEKIQSLAWRMLSEVKWEDSPNG